MPHSHLPEPINILIINQSPSPLSVESEITNKFIDYVKANYQNAYVAKEAHEDEIYTSFDNEPIVIISDFQNKVQLSEAARRRDDLIGKSSPCFQIIFNANFFDTDTTKALGLFASAKLLPPNPRDNELNEAFDSIIKRALKDEFEKPLDTLLFKQAIGLIPTAMSRERKPSFEMHLFAQRIVACWEYLEQDTKDTLKRYLRIEEGENMRIGYPTREQRDDLLNKDSSQRQKPDAKAIEAQQELA
jgi:uncharacterized protein (DUF736 family)